MNIDIDKRLQEILIRLAGKDGDPAYSPEAREAIAAIHKAYKDAGYVDATINNTSNPLYLTGAEWLGRFTREIKLYPMTTNMHDDREIFEAARRASGIKEDSQDV